MTTVEALVASGRTLERKFRARAAYQAQKQEALSLAMALHLSVLDTTGTRAPAFAAPGGLPTLSPLMELAPAPAAARLPDDFDPRRMALDLPPLVKAYLRVGATIGEGAYIDRAFNTVDVCVVMPVERISARYAARFSAAA